MNQDPQTMCGAHVETSLRMVGGHELKSGCRRHLGPTSGNHSNFECGTVT